MVILGIETSCDETSASILKNGLILSNIVHSQIEHVEFGGVVPEIASKNHEKLIFPITEKAIKEANIKIHEISAIAVTYGPGLIGSLLVGLNFAKGFSQGLNIPLIGVNHLEGHLISNCINNDMIKHPYLCLLVSGGHTQIVLVNNNSYEIIADTVDDAAGEAFDKGAKILNLKYPGGPEIEKYAIRGDLNTYKFTIPNVKNNHYNYSFSGIKTALLYKVNKMTKSEIISEINNLSACYQEVIIDTLLQKLCYVINDYKINNISIVGGVSANKRFRDKSKHLCEEYNLNITFPKKEYCTDNAAMIAMVGYLKYKKNEFSNLDIVPNPTLKFK